MTTVISGSPGISDAVEAVYSRALAPFEGSLEQTGLLREAEAATGLSDWGGQRWGERGFRERLQVLCEALEAEVELSPVGRSRAHSRLHVMLCSRLRFIRWRQVQGQAAPDPVRAPLVGAGLPRAGTTFLHNLLSQDPDHLMATAAQAAIPIPPGGGVLAERVRNDLYQRILGFQGQTAPDVTAIHPFAADAPEECIFLQEGACASLYGAYFNAPDFARVAAAGTPDAYAWQRGLMEVLQTEHPGKRWLLKAPSHLMYWDTMLSAFPDAMIFVNHRDPGKVIPSICSLFMKLRSLFSDQGTDPRTLGPQLAAVWSEAMTQLMAWRQAHPEARVIDVHYKDLTADPIGEAARLYAAFGLTLSAAAQDRMASFLAHDHHGKGPARQYTLAEYGLDEAAIEAAFGDYIDHFGVEREKRA